MDMDMDVPLPEELELLEANSHFFEDDLELGPPDDEPDHEPPPAPPADLQHNGLKRPRPEGMDSPDINDLEISDEKRSRMQQVRTEIDEDWLRYSLPRESDDVLQEEEEGEFVVLEEKIVSKYASEIDGDFIPVTAPGGEDRVYAKMCRTEWDLTSKKLDVKQRYNRLIFEPINVLLQRAEQLAFTKALRASSERQQGDVGLPEKPVVNELLWVDKYSPNSFTELLSDEQTNREVLLWLKQWDSSVFGSEIRSTSDEVLSSLRRHSSIAQHQKLSDSSFSRKYRGHRSTNGSFRHSNNLDPEGNNLKGIQDLGNKKSKLTGPPEHKILLLCGPPGLGKTTLAHVAAKHCGYRVVEINASDDRSTSTVEAKILDVVQMNSVMADLRPKCLVIDEIDGALNDGKGAVEVILRMVSAERKSDITIGKEHVGKEEQTGRMSSKKGRKTASLLRPVICICNDLYAPALRPLRQVAKVHMFVQPTVSRVVSRLKYICSKEGMKTSSIALTTLAEYTECDIRSCLNTLQFLYKKKETLNVLDISSQVVGRKDISKGVFDIWKEIFQKRRMKRERKSDIGHSGTSHEFDSLHSLISNRGDYDVILDGIYENLLQLHYHDPVMQKTVKCLNCLGVSDWMNRYVMRTQQMPLHAYQPPLAIGVHRLVAQNQKPNIEWPKSYQRYRTILLEKMDILRSWHCKITPNISRHLSTKSFAEDSISPLLHILSPPTLRPVALHLLSEKEKKDVADLVSTMVSYSVTYKNMKSDPLSSNLENETALDASALTFDPPINDFVNFKGYKSCHRGLALAVKQVLVHEVEKEKILQISTGRSAHLTDRCNEENQDAVKEESSRAQSAKIYRDSKSKQTVNNSLNASSSAIPSTLGSGTIATGGDNLKSSGATKKPSRGSSNFFDRFRKLSSKGSQSTDNIAQIATTSERDSRPLLFKYNEGFTNAVKRPVRMRDFF